MLKTTTKASPSARETMETESDSGVSVWAGPVFTGLAGVKSDCFASFANHPIFGFPIVESAEEQNWAWSYVSEENLNALAELNRASPFSHGRVEVVLGKDGAVPPANTSITDCSRESDWGHNTSLRRDYPSIDLTPIAPIDITTSSGSSSTLSDDLKLSQGRISRYRRALRDLSQDSFDQDDSSRPISRYAELIPEDSRSDSQDLFKSVDALVTAGVIKEEEEDDDLDVSCEPRPLVPKLTAQKVQIPSFCPVPAKVLSDSDLRLEEEMLSPELPCGFSPLYRKIVLCEDRRHQRTLSDSRRYHRSLALLHSFPCSGYRNSVTLEFSNGTRLSRALIDAERDSMKLPVPLMTAKIARWMLANTVGWISCGFEHVAIVTVEGEVFTWGLGNSGALGHSDSRSCSEPQRVKSLSNKGISYVECGGYHTAALSESGRLWLWGRADVNQLGVRTLGKDEFGWVAPAPVEVQDLKGRSVKGVACGEAHTLLLTCDGEVYASGWAEDGQLGLPASLISDGVMTMKFTLVPALSHIVKVAAGALFSAALTSSGSVLTWGNGEQGQLGQGSKVLRSSTPVTVSALQHEAVIDVVCGENSVLCACSGGRTYGWGSGLAGAFDSGQFAPGSELVCYVPRELCEIRTPHLYRLPHRPPKSHFLTSLQQELKRLEDEDCG